VAEKGLKIATGTVVDATIISARSSTKNADKARGPEMHQTKGNLTVVAGFPRQEPEGGARSHNSWDRGSPGRA
jgi:hypothetical protein